jgi:hypothetical protein
MKKVTLLTLCVALLTATSCKKENEPAFNPVGKWRGMAFIYHTMIFNNADGSSKLYAAVPGMDTSRAFLKFNGNYVYTGGKLNAIYLYPGGDDSIIIEPRRLSYDRIEGLLISTATGEALEFDLKKE